MRSNNGPCNVLPRAGESLTSSASGFKVRRLKVCTAVAISKCLPCIFSVKLGPLSQSLYVVTVVIVSLKHSLRIMLLLPYMF